MSEIRNLVEEVVEIKAEIQRLKSKFECKEHNLISNLAIEEPHALSINYNRLYRMFNIPRPARRGRCYPEGEE